MYVCMYVCMCGCMNECMYLCVYVCIYMFVYSCMNINVCIYVSNHVAPTPPKGLARGRGGVRTYQ